MKVWVRDGLIWGAIMFVFMCFLFPLYDKKEITLKSIVTGLIIWSISGIIFGYATRKRKPDKQI